MPIYEKVIVLISAGFSENTIDEMDVRDIDCLFEYIRKQNNIDRVIRLLDNAESMRMAQACFSAKNGNNIYNKWFQRQHDSILEKPQNNFWDRLKGKKGKQKIT